MLWLSFLVIALARAGTGGVCGNHGNVERSCDDQAPDYVTRHLSLRRFGIHRALFLNTHDVVSDSARATRASERL